MVDISEVFQRSRKGEGWTLAVLLTPKASHTKIGDVAVDANGQPYLKVYVTAVPEDHKANKALLDLLAKTFRVSKSSLSLISGLTDRRKVIRFLVEPTFP